MVIIRRLLELLIVAHNHRRGLLFESTLTGEVGGVGGLVFGQKSVSGISRLLQELVSHQVDLALISIMIITIFAQLLRNELPRILLLYFLRMIGCLICSFVFHQTVRRVHVDQLLTLEMLTFRELVTLAHVAVFFGAEGRI